MFYEGTDQSQIGKYLDYAETHDMEGIMVNLDTPYQCKRVRSLMKVKQFYTYDLRIVGFEEGAGKLAGMLGAFVVDFKGNTVNVGVGFDDNARRDFWSNRNSLIGRVAEIKYKEVTKDKVSGKESLQFPVFCCLRENGKEVSLN